jgi:AcrR family transcriptional regulator
LRDVRTTVDDPRYQRVRQLLVRAVLDMAAAQPAETISVAQLTSEAGVSRASFYAHATSPAALLADALIAELRPNLDSLAQQMTDDHADYVSLWRSIYLVLLSHVQRHRAVYEIVIAHETAVSSALTAYFEEAAAQYVGAVKVRLDGPPPGDLWVAMAISQQAHNMIAVIRAWIVTGMAESPEQVVDVYLTLAPPWQLARPDADGRISLRRARSYGPSRARTSGQEPVDRQAPTT